MAAGAVAAVVGSNARARPNAQIAPVIKADERGISSAEDAELRALERNAEAPGERTIGVYEERKPAKKGKITKKPWYIIDPRTNKYMGYWDGISMVRARRLSLARRALAARAARRAAIPLAAPRPRPPPGASASPAVLRGMHAKCTARQRTAARAHART